MERAYFSWWRLLRRFTPRNDILLTCHCERSEAISASRIYSQHLSICERYNKKRRNSFTGEAITSESSLSGGEKVNILYPGAQGAGSTRRGAKGVAGKTFFAIPRSARDSNPFPKTPKRFLLNRAIVLVSAPGSPLATW